MPLKNINLTGNPAQPYDLQSRQMSLAQQTAIANALIEQSMERTSPVIRTGVGNQFGSDIPNIGDPIAQVVQAIMGKRKLEEANAGMNELNLETHRRSQQEIGDILGARFGRMQPPLLPNDDEGNRNPPVQGKGSTMRALQLASQATTPAGKAMFADLNKGLLSNEEAYRNIDKLDPASVQTALLSQDLSDVRHKIELKESEGAVRPYQGGAPLGPATPINTFRLDKDQIPGLPLAVSEVTGQPKGIAGGTTSPPAKYQEQYTAELMKQFGERKKQYDADIGDMQNYAQIQEQIRNIPAEKFGTVAEFRNWANKAAEVLGGAKMPNTDNMEVLQAAAGKMVIDNIHKFAPASDKDVVRLSTTLGNEGFTKRALEQVVSIAEQRTARRIETHQKTMKEVPIPNDITREQHLQLFAPPYSIQPLPASGSGPATTPSGSTIKYYDPKAWKFEPAP